MIYICEELKEIINKKKMISYNSLVYEILKSYRKEFGLEMKELEIFYDIPNSNSDVELHNNRFFYELETDFPEGINSSFDILEKLTSVDSDVKFSLINVGITYRKVVSVREKIEEDEKFINEYTTNINKTIRTADINIVNRDEELELLEIFLLMKTKNNVLITGKPGVGKTALVEGLAEKIEKGKVRSQLVGKQIISVDIPRLLGNTKYRGEFEDKLTRLLDISSRRGYILFIDEAHIVVGAGASEGGISASDILKPYLLNESLRFICATTEDEYVEIAKDKALNRRFNAIMLREFTKNQMLSLGVKLCKPYEEYHNINFFSNDISHIVNILSSDKYSMKSFPDKFVEFVDFIGSYYSNLGTLNRKQIDTGFDYYESSRILLG